MKEVYHQQILASALGEIFDPNALEEVIRANLSQDVILTGQIGHPEFHFDANSFVESRAYMEAQRDKILPAIQQGKVEVARGALGRLTHAAQDFYAHSNYISLWLEKQTGTPMPGVDQVDPLDEELLSSPNLRSGTIIYFWELLNILPWIGKAIKPLYPRDSHAWLNLDGPEQGEAFPYVMRSAIKRTRYEYEITIRGWKSEFVDQLTGKG